MPEVRPAPARPADIKAADTKVTDVKTIKPGDEITYDYGNDYFKNVLKPIGCRCVKCTEKRREERRERARKLRRKLTRANGA